TKTKALRRKLAPTNILRVNNEDLEFLRKKGLAVVILADKEFFGIWENKIVYEPRKLRDLIIEIKDNYLCTEAGKIGSKDPLIVGGKAAGLSELVELGKISNNIKTLPGFYITSNAYDLFMFKNNLNNELNELDLLTEEWIKKELIGGLTDQEKLELQQKVEEKAKEIYEKVLEGDVPSEVKEEIEKKYSQLSSEVGEDNIAVSVRSSGTGEDSRIAAFPGQFESYLNVKGKDSVIEHYKKVIASRFLPNAIVYAVSLRIKYLRRKIEEKRIDVKDIDQLLREDDTLRFRKMKMAVGVVTLVLKPIVAGQAYSVDPITARSGIHINASYGYGVIVADSSANLDSWFVDLQGKEILERRKGTKFSKYIKDDQGGLKRVETTKEEREKYCLEDQQILEIASAIITIRDYYRKMKNIKHIDVEFVIDEEFGLRILQVRPETKTEVSLEKKVVFVKDAGSAQEIYRGGITGSEGAVIGELQYAKTVDEVKSGVILLTANVDHRWTAVFPRIKGLITDTGDIGGHGASTSRDYGIPAIIGCNNACESLKKYSGEVITVDANNRVVYLGEAILEERIAKTEVWLEEPLPIENEFAQYEDPKEELEADWKRTTKAEQTKVIDNVRYIGRPNYPISQLQLEIYSKAFEELAKLLNITLRQKIKDNILYILFEDNIEIRRALRKKSLEELIEFDRRRIEDTEEFLKFSEEFEITPEKIERFIDLYTKVNMWMDIAWDLGVVASIWRDKYLCFVHPNYRGIFLEASKSEELSETEIRDEINRALIEEIKNNSDLEKIFIESEPEEIVQKLEGQYPEFYNKIYKHSEQFRFGPSVLSIKRPISNVCKELKKLINLPEEEYKQDYEELKIQISSMLEQYPTMAKALKLARNEVRRKETIHHLKYRAQWKISDKLFDFGKFLVEKGEFTKPEEIFNIGIEELKDKVRKYFKEYHIQLRKPSSSSLNSFLEHIFSRPNLSLQELLNRHYVIKDLQFFKLLLESLLEIQEGRAPPLELPEETIQTLYNCLF
ncbi:MAG: hypothetical protein DRP68_07005, partial [Candidatus Omnitrophota bacterium]